MTKTHLLPAALAFCMLARAQSDTVLPRLSRTATVKVSVTDLKGQPRKSDKVLFRAKQQQQDFAGVSNAAGKFTINLPAGDLYTIIVKNLADTTRTGLIHIPALDSDQVFTTPFVVNIKYEPARTFTLDDVHFDFGKASLRPESFVELEELLEYLTQKDDIRIEIAGHTDNIGKDADNLKLSQARANAIRDYLLKKGIKPSRVMAKGYGASEPVADNDTEEGRQMNRRTEVRIL